MSTRVAKSSKPSIAKPAARWAPIEAFLERRAVLITVAIVLLATLRITATYPVFSHTFDEPAHIACGMEWLDKGTYTYEPQHPPLARVFAAVLPKLSGARGSEKKSMWDDGLAILASRKSVDQTLALARTGILPFFWIACWIAFSMGRSIAGPAAGVLSVFLVSMSPAVLAHAGLATTDMALTAMMLAAVHTGWRWAAEPTWPRALAFGACTGFAVLAKFSAVPFLPSIVMTGCFIWLMAERPARGRLLALLRVRAPGAAAAAAAAALVVWAGYRFSFGPVEGWPVSLPAPELFAGIEQVRKHDATGHLTYLLGMVNTVGWPYFYIVALAVKTPLAVLALGTLGLAMATFPRFLGLRACALPSVVIGVLGFSSFFSNIRIGTRHVLPATTALHIAAACVAVWLLRRSESRAILQGAVGLAVVSFVVSSVAVHPDYLSYFNVIAADKPERFLVDSDLDWGQDVKRLSARLRQAGAQHVYFNQFAPGDLRQLYGFPEIRPLDVNGPGPGWNAVSLTQLKYGTFGDTRYVLDPGVELWPEQIRPVERVGRGILLYCQPAR